MGPRGYYIPISPTHFYVILLYAVAAQSFSCSSGGIALYVKKRPQGLPMLSSWTPLSEVLHFFVKLIPKYFILFYAIVNRIFYQILLLVYRNKIDFYMLTLVSCNFAEIVYYF